MHKILFIITKADVGGAQKFVKEQIEVLKDDFDVYLCTHKEEIVVVDTNQITKGKLISKLIEKKFSIKFLFLLVSFLKKNKIDLVICNSANAGIYGRVASFVLNKNCCYFSHGWSSEYNGGKMAFIYNKIELFFSFITTKIICVSNSDNKVAIEKIGINPKKLFVLKNATFPIIPINTNKRVAKNKIKVLSLARFINPKRIDLMIKSFESIEFAELFIAGDGVEFNYWSNYIKINEIKNVTLLGEVASFSSFNSYDVFMLLSNSEGLPISAIEAMSVGLPLVLSNVGGCPELIKNNGILVENNIPSIIEGLKNVAENYESYAKNSLILYEENHNLEKMKAKYIELYKSIIS